MKSRSLLSLGLGLAIALSLSACDSNENGLGVIPEGWLLAQLQGDSASTYRGSGFFHSNLDIRNWPDELPARFYLYSKGTNGPLESGVIIMGGDGRRPQTGNYDLGWSEDGPHEWNMTYTEVHGDSIIFYGATEGELEITNSTADSISGKFELTALGNLVCDVRVRGLTVDPEDNPPLPCVDRSGEEAEEVQVSGSFSTIPGQTCITLVDPDAELADLPRPPVALCR